LRIDNIPIAETITVNIQLRAQGVSNTAHAEKINPFVAAFFREG
jgi:hypothetical protein